MHKFVRLIKKTDTKLATSKCLWVCVFFDSLLWILLRFPAVSGCTWRGGCGRAAWWGVRGAESAAGSTGPVWKWPRPEHRSPNPADAAACSCSPAPRLSEGSLNTDLQHTAQRHFNHRHVYHFYIRGRAIIRQSIGPILTFYELLYAVH